MVEDNKKDAEDCAACAQKNGGFKKADDECKKRISAPSNIRKTCSL